MGHRRREGEGGIVGRVIRWKRAKKGPSCFQLFHLTAIWLMDIHWSVTPTSCCFMFRHLHNFFHLRYFFLIVGMKKESWRDELLILRALFSFFSVLLRIIFFSFPKTFFFFFFGWSRDVGLSVDSGWWRRS